MFETGDDARGDQTSAGLSGDRGEIADHQRHNVKCAELWRRKTQTFLEMSPYNN